MTIADTFKIDRDGRTYDVKVYQDDDPINPRKEYDHPATQFYITGYRGDVYADELDGAAGDALAHFLDKYGRSEFDQIERAFHLWTVITGSPVKLFTGQSIGYSQSDWHDWYALVDTDVMERDGYGATPAELARMEAGEYAAYAYGDVYGVQAFHTDPTGREWESDTLWGVVDRSGDYVREVAGEQADKLAAEIDAHNAELARQANMVGAGFVGVL